MMTKNRAAKAAIRRLAAEQVEPYTLARRQLAQEVPAIEAWLDDWEGLVVYGTHDPVEALAAVRAARPEWLNPEDPAYDEALADEAFYHELRPYWTRPLAQLEGELLDGFTEAGAGRVPYLFTNLG